MAKELEQLLRELGHKEPENSLASNVLKAVKAETNLLKERKDYSPWIPTVLLGSFATGLVLCIILIAMNFNQLSIDWTSSIVQSVLAVGGCWSSYAGMDALLKKVFN